MVTVGGKYLRISEATAKLSRVITQRVQLESDVVEGGGVVAAKLQAFGDGLGGSKKLLRGG